MISIMWKMFININDDADNDNINVLIDKQVVMGPPARAFSKVVTILPWKMPKKKLDVNNFENIHPQLKVFLC